VVFWNAARSVVLVTEDDDDDSRLVAQRKANYARLVPGRAVPRPRDRAADARPGYGEPVVTARLRFVEYADDINGADVLAGPKTTKTESAAALLEALLADGDWHESDGLKQLMNAAGFPERTVQRAAKELRLEHDRRGFPEARTWWRRRSRQAVTNIRRERGFNSIKRLRYAGATVRANAPTA